MKIFRRSRSDYITFGIDPKKVSLFKKRYKKGDKVRAKLIKILDEKRAIIDVDGLKLVAYFTNPVEGVERGYIELEVIQLSPFIRLKHVSTKEGINFYV